MFEKDDIENAKTGRADAFELTVKSARAYDTLLIKCEKFEKLKKLLYFSGG